MTTDKASYPFIALCLALFWPALAAGQICAQWKEAVRIGELQSQLSEASGVAASRQFPGRLYHINDSGDDGQFYVTSMDGKGTHAVRVKDFDPEDTEALSLGPCPRNGSGSCIYLGDIGDNSRKRKSIEIAVVDETKDFPETVTLRSRLKLTYPDGPHDAESLAIQPDGNILILTKERPGRLFKANPNVADQTLVAVRTVDAGSPATDMAISDDGKRVMVLTYADATEYSIDFKQQQRIKLAYLQQQESVAYLPGSQSFIYTTERLLPVLPQWIMRMDCADR
jgi:hypothetical protein